MGSTVIRFVSQAKHPPFGHRTGVFKLAYKLRRGLPTTSAHAEELDGLLSWLEGNLAEPRRFSTSRHPHAQETAISWIKASAGDHVRRLRRLASLVEEAAEHPIEELRTERPGYIVFEDDHQVVALPFSDTPR